MPIAPIAKAQETFASSMVVADFRILKWAARSGEIRSMLESSIAYGCRGNVTADQGFSASTFTERKQAEY